MGGRGGKGNINGFIDWLSKEGKGGGAPRPLDISKFGNMTLEDAERRIRNLKHEELFVFDKDGKLVEAYKGILILFRSRCPFWTIRAQPSRTAILKAQQISEARSLLLMSKICLSPNGQSIAPRPAAKAR